MNDHDLHDQLERLGRRPVPPPRPEFVESLLARIQLTDDLREPAPVIYMRRQRWARARVAVAGAAAAVLLGAVGMLALARGGSGSGEGLPVELASVGQTPALNAEVEDGHLVPPENADFESVPDATYTATCKQGGRVKFGDGDSLECQTDDTLELVIEGGAIKKATRVGRAVVEETPAEAPTTAPTTFHLESTSTIEGSVDLSWDPVPGAAGYVVERAFGAGAQALAIAETDATAPEVAAGTTQVTESFAGLDPSVSKVAYRVFALDEDGEELAASRTVILTLEWVPSTAPTR